MKRAKRSDVVRWGAPVVLLLALTACGSDAATTAESTAAASPSPSETMAGGDEKNDTNEKNDKNERNDKNDRDASGQSEVDTSNSVLPSVQVKDVATGGTVDFAGLVPSDRPILLWAWAPHCPICAAEAPGVEAFADENGSDLKVVGIGTQDDLALAEDFVANYGVRTPQMLWDPGFESWQALEITGQPTWVLLSPGGEELGRWQGGLPEGAITALL